MSSVSSQKLVPVEISGMVKKCSDGTAFPGAKVTAKNNGKLISSTTTQSDGTYNLSFQSNYKVFNVTASANGHKPSIQTVTVNKNTAKANFQLGINDAYVWNGWVTNPNQDINFSDGTTIHYTGATNAFTTISDAVKWITSGNTVYIAPGTYYEDSITMGKSINLHGENQATTIIDAEQADRIFYISSGVTVNIQQLTLTKGSSDQGSVIYNFGTVTVNNSTFLNNTAKYWGGAIDNIGTLTVYNSTFTNNTALYYNGGAIDSTGTLTIYNSTFTNNTDPYGFGGAVNNYGGTLTVDNSTFTNNTALYYNGGALNNYSGTGTVNNSSFTNNTSNHGGAIYNSGTLTVDNGTLINNKATNSGGGAIENIGRLTVDNGNFTDNTATNSGGGGAIENIGGTVTVYNSTFTSNSATTTFGGNNIGGAIENVDGTVTVNNSTFTNNRAASVVGGAVYGGAIYNSGTVIVNNSTFLNNTTTGNGGAIYNIGTATANNSTFIGNSATIVGGMICNYGGTATVNFSRIIGNTASLNGAIANYYGAVDAKYNWWGSNTDPSANISPANVSYNPWIVLTVTANPTTINVGGTSMVIADLLHDSTYDPTNPIASYHNPSNGHVPDGIPVTFNIIPAFGTITDITPSSSTTLNGVVTGIYHPNGETFKTPVQVYAIVDNENTVYATINIKTPINIVVDTKHNFPGQTVHLVAHITDNIGNLVDEGQVQFTVNGVNAGLANVNNGIATVNWLIPSNWNAGNYDLIADYSGTSIYSSSTKTGTLTVDTIPTSTVINNLTGNKGQTVNLTATLMDTLNQRTISGKTIKFLINGTIVGSAVTNSNGIATLPYTIQENGGSYLINAIFNGDNVYNSSTGNATLKLRHSNIYMTVTTNNTHPTVGETVLITFKVGNKGPDTANNVVLTLRIPEGMEYVNATVTTGLFTYNPSTRTITWNIGDVPVGDPKLLLNAKVLHAGNYTIQPTVKTITYDPNIQSNTGSIIINVSNNTTNPTNPAVNAETFNAETIPMQPTGTPIIPLLIGTLMTVAGIATTRKN